MLDVPEDAAGDEGDAGDEGAVEAGDSCALGADEPDVDAGDSEVTGVLLQAAKEQIITTAINIQATFFIYYSS